MFGCLDYLIDGIKKVLLLLEIIDFLLCIIFTISSTGGSSLKTISMVQEKRKLLDWQLLNFVDGHGHRNG